MRLFKPLYNFGNASKIRRMFGRLKKDENGTTAIEFAIVAGPFFLLIFSIIESSLFFFAGQYLENSVDNVTRKIRTGQLQNVATAEDFKVEFCKEIVALFDCENGLKVRVETAFSFDALSAPPEPKDDGTGKFELDDSDYSYTQPTSVEIVQVTASYLWPIYTNYSAPLTESGISGKALMHATAVVRTEPFN